MTTYWDSLQRIADMPRIKFIFGKDWRYSPWCYSIGVMWDKNLCPLEGEYIYRRRFVLHLTFHLSIEK